MNNNLKNKEYQLEVRVRNNCLLQVMNMHGIKTNSELASICEITPNDASWMMNLTQSPISKKTGEYRKQVIRVAERLMVMPEDLFPEEQLHTPLKSNKALIDVSRDEISQIGSSLNYLDNEKIIAALETLHPREKKVLVEHYGLDGHDPKTLTSIGSDMGISGVMVGQIHQKALRNLRKPTTYIKERSGAKEVYKEHFV